MMGFVAQRALMRRDFQRFLVLLSRFFNAKMPVVASMAYFFMTHKGFAYIPGSGADDRTRLESEATMI